jgi:hypothetical protein
MELLRYVLPHLCAGCAGGVVAALGVVATNLGSLRDLVMTTQGGWLALCLLILGFAVTFGSIAIGAAIMALGDSED